MKLLSDANLYPQEIADNASDIAWIETKLGCLIVRADMILGLKREGIMTLGWAIQPEDEMLVCVFPTYNWRPGIGPRATLKEAAQALRWNLEQCVRVEVGKPGPHSGVAA